MTTESFSEDPGFYLHPSPGDAFAPGTLGGFRGDRKERAEVGRKLLNFKHWYKSLEIRAMWRQSGGMATIPKTRSEKETERQLKVLQETADRLFSNPETSKEFFVSRGYITRKGNLTARYRSK